MADPTQEVIDDIAIMRDPMQYPDIRDAARKRVERAIVDGASLCTFSFVVKMAAQRPFLDINALKGLLANKSYDTGAMVLGACLFNAAAMSKPSAGISTINAVRIFLKKLKIIGTPSAFGYASLTGPEDLYVVKSSRDPENDNLAHEAVIGGALNSLREHVPNFVYTYGAFGCSPPVMEGGGSLTWCTTDVGAVTYLLLEALHNTMSLHNWIQLPNITATDVASMLFQLFAALWLAYDRSGLRFTHYDLHDDNVLVRDLGREYLIPYDTPDGKRYLRTRYLGIIIDFGFSYAEVVVTSTGGAGGTVGFGLMDKRRKERYEVDAVPNQSYDFNRLLRRMMSSVYNPIHGAKQELLVRLLSNIYPGVYTRANLTDWFRNPVEDRYMYIPPSRTSLDTILANINRELDHTGLVRRSRTNDPTGNPYPVWNCEQGDCQTRETYLQRLEAPQAFPPTMTTLYDVCMSAKIATFEGIDDPARAKLVAAAQATDVQRIFSVDDVEIRRLLNRSKDLGRAIGVIPDYTQVWDLRFYPDGYYAYRNQLYNVALINENYFEVIKWIGVARCALQQHGLNAEATFAVYRPHLVVLRNFIRHSKNIIMENVTRGPPLRVWSVDITRSLHGVINDKQLQDLVTFMGSTQRVIARSIDYDERIIEQQIDLPWPPVAVAPPAPMPVAATPAAPPAVLNELMEVEPWTWTYAPRAVPPAAAPPAPPPAPPTVFNDPRAAVPSWALYDLPLPDSRGSAGSTPALTAIMDD